MSESTTLATPQEFESISIHEPLKISDRCDKGNCKAQALVLFANDKEHPVYLCGHDASDKDTAIALLSQNFRIIEDLRGTVK